MSARVTDGGSSVKDVKRVCSCANVIACTYTSLHA